MTEQSTKRPKLHPAYKPATADDRLTVFFVGNTAVVADIGFTYEKDKEGRDWPTIDPYQMIAAGEYLKMKGLQAIQHSELAEAKRQMEIAQAQVQKDKLRQIIVTNEMPPEDFVDPGVLKGK